MNIKKLLCLGLILAMSLMLLLALAEDVALSEDIYSFQLELGDVVYTLPITYAALEEDGWTYTGKTDETLVPNTYTLGYWKKGDDKLTTHLINLDIDVLPVTECLVAGMQVDLSDMKSGTSCTLPGDITLGSASLENVLAAYGTPSNQYDGSYAVTCTYQLESYREVKLSINNETGVVDSFTVRNFENPFPIDYEKVSDEVPQAVLDYVAPTELGDDPLSFICQYGGALYRLPAPFAAFAEDGWVINGDENEIVAARDSLRVDIRKDNQTLRTSLRNPSDKATQAKNCFVIEVIDNINSTRMELILPRGVKLGTTQEELLEAYGDLTVKESDSTTYFYYEYGESVDGRIEVIVNKESLEITGLTMRHRKAEE